MLLGATTGVNGLNPITCLVILTSPDEVVNIFGELADRVCEAGCVTKNLQYTIQVTRVA